MGYWKSKVLPKIKKVFEKDGTKKAAAAEACKSFDDSKEEISKEFEEKKTELHPKVTEIYEASSAEIKILVKEPKEAGIKKSSTAVHKFLEELVKIDFPGSKQVCEASSKLGPVMVSGPVLFLFEKVSTFVVTEEKKVEPPPPTTVAEEETSGKEKEIAIEEEKEKEDEVKAEPTPSEPAKVEEAEPVKP
ncbi:hypothetical protein HHK36_023134 [Tetracentron sinense]|uniref:Plasma membrane-associated cation-binding protein 1 n=1 Tax=Tetracentron sinense TaxID=13715 RepID=A0A834YN50_TETSI|nr:hypothetical protein HHK36_023134 [Tetracentron sinense]